MPGGAPEPAPGGAHRFPRWPPANRPAPQPESAADHEPPQAVDIEKARMVPAAATPGRSIGAQSAFERRIFKLGAGLERELCRGSGGAALGDRFKKDEKQVGELQSKGEDLPEHLAAGPA